MSLFHLTIFLFPETSQLFRNYSLCFEVPIIPEIIPEIIPA